MTHCSVCTQETLWKCLLNWNNLCIVSVFFRISEIFWWKALLTFWKHYDPDISSKYEKFYGCHWGLEMLSVQFTQKRLFNRESWEGKLWNLWSHSECSVLFHYRFYTHAWPVNTEVLGVKFYRVKWIPSLIYAVFLKLEKFFMHISSCLYVSHFNLT